MTDSIKPALQPDEWERALVDSDNGKSDFLDITYGVFAGREDVFLPPRESSGHALAALALYGQTFGISPADIQLLRYVAPFCDMKEDHDAVIVLADKLAALLPPEK